MKIYFDNCCYNRPYDNPAHKAQANVRREITAIMDAVQVCETSGFPILGSAAVIAEIDDIKNLEKRKNVRGFYERVVTAELVENENIIARAQELNKQGIKGLDAYHIAFAESANVEYLLTTDIKFEKAAEKLYLKTKVINPINFMMEYAIWLLLSM